MPRKLESDSIKAELITLEALISDCDETGDFIGRIQNQSRLEALKKELTDLESENENKASVALFFGGKPVIGSKAIDAEFAGNSLSSFQEIVSKVFAKEELGSLGNRGPISFARNSSLMVTGLARGSFGFVLDEVSDQLDLTETALSHVVDLAVKLITHISSENFEQYESAMIELDSRILNSLRKFFTNLDSSQATLRIVESNQDFTLDEEAIHRAKERIDNTNINEETKIFEGVLVGFLQEHRKFELKLEENNEILYGSVSKAAMEEFEDRIQSKNLLNSFCKVELLVRKISRINKEDKNYYSLIKFM